MIENNHFLISEITLSMDVSYFPGSNRTVTGVNLFNKPGIAIVLFFFND